MAELEPPTSNVPETPAPGAGRGVDDVALDLMKFIAVTTGYGKPSQSSTGFSGKAAAASPEDHAQALLDLFERCRRTMQRDK